MKHRKKITKVVAISCLIMGLTACGGGSGSGGQQNPNDESDSSTGTGTITFLELNDLHAHLTSHNDVDRINNEEKVVHRGGLARIATLVKNVRAENPNTILMNIGDTYHGGVEAFYTQGNAIVEPVNALGIDVGVPGNWDFAFGPGVTRARYTDIEDQFTNAVGDIAKPNFPNLAANVTYNMGQRTGEEFLPPTLMKTMNGINIGFIGLTSDIVPRMHEMLAIGLSFVEQEAEYLSLIEEHANNLRQNGAHFVVVMSELGIQKDFRLANQMTDGLIDVMFSAHTHELTFEPIVASSGTWVVEAGNDTVLGRMDVTFDNGIVKDKQWEIINVDSTLEEDSEVKALVTAARAPFLNSDVAMTLSVSDTEILLERPINTVLGKVASGSHRRHALVNDFNASYTKMLRDFTGTKVSMTPGFRFDAVIASDDKTYEDPAIIVGDMTIEDAYRFFPVPFILSTGNVSGLRLKEVMESNLTAVFSPNIFKQSGGWFDGFNGLTANINLANDDEQRIVDLRFSDTGSEILNEETLSVAGCSRPFDFDSSTTLCSYDGFTDVMPVINQTTGKAWSGVGFLIYGVESGLFTEAEQNQIVDINMTPLWPNQEFYQPLEGAQ